MALRNGICLVLGSVVAAIAALPLSGCANGSSRGVPLAGAESNTAGPLAVDVQNQLGEVEVVVDPTVTRPFVEAVPMTRTAPMGPIDRDSNFKPWVAGQIAESEGGRILRVLSTAREGEAPRPVYILVRVPSCEGVRVRNTGGPVTLTGVGGTIDVETTPGTRGLWDEGAAVRMRTTREVASNVSLVSSDGEVLMTVPWKSKGKIEAQAPETIIQIAAVPELQSNGAATTSLNGRYTGSLNGGENAINLRSGTRVRFTTTYEPVPYPPKRAAATAESAAPEPAAK